MQFIGLKIVDVFKKTKIKYIVPTGLYVLKDKIVNLLFPVSHQQMHITP